MISEDEIVNNYTNIELEDFEDENDFFGFEAAKKKVFAIQEQKRISNLEAKINYAANRIFVNNGDSYHGKLIIQEISQVPFEDIEYTDFDNSLNEHSKPSAKELEEQKLHHKSNNLKQSNYVDPNEALGEKYTNENVHDNNIETELTFITNVDTIPMYDIQKPKIKMKIHETETIKYEIVTTVKNKLQINDKRNEYLKQTKKIIIPNNKAILMNEIQKCAVVVYDITLDKNQITEAKAALQKILEVINFNKNHPKNVIAKQSGIRVFILISSIQTWALTKSNNENPITQTDYKHRICHPNFQTYYDMENYILILNDIYRGYFYGIILAPGLVYGHGEHILKHIYKTIFSDTEQLLIPQDNNNLPIIHVENLAKIVKNLVVNYDKVITPYIIGIETSKFSLRNIIEAIKHEVNKTEYTYSDYSSLFLNPGVTQTVYDMITMSIYIVPVIDSYITKFISSEKSIPRILTKPKELICEYLKENYEMKNIIINGPDETNFTKRIANAYNLKFIDPVAISEEFLNIMETGKDSRKSLEWLENYINNTENIQHTELSNEYDVNENYDNLKILGNKEILEEQKKHFEDQGQIFDRYLIPFIKYKLINNVGKKCGYIISNFPKTIEQAQNLFNLESLGSEKENKYFLEDKINPTIIIDLIMAGKNVIDKVTQNGPIEKLQLGSNSKLLLDQELDDRLHDWFSFQSMYTEDEIIKHILENENVVIRRNHKLVDYLEILIKPKMYKKYLLVTENNLTLIDDEEFDKLFDSLIISMPLTAKDTEDEDEVKDIEAMISKIYGSKEVIIKNSILDKNEENDTKNPAQLLNEQQIKEEEIQQQKLVLKNIKTINFLIKRVNPVLVNGILEAIKIMPGDPIDFLVEYIYDHNMYNPCDSSPLNKKPKVANGLNKHLL